MDGLDCSRSDLAGAAAICRGVGRALRQQGLACLTEFTLATGRRVDVIGLARDGKLTVVEVKSSVADYRADRKWHEYLPFCDYFYFAVDADFPQALIPEECGLIVADSFDAAFIRPAAEGSMNGSRRKALTLRFARDAARRTHRILDPEIG